MGDPPAADYIDSVRSFNRFYTNVMGVLSERLLESPYTLTEVRVLFELAHHGDASGAVSRHDDGPDATELRRALGLDAGYMSRILSRFQSDGLIERRASERDRRRLLLRLTEVGHEVFAELDERSSAQIAQLLGKLDEPAQRRTVEAMGLIRSNLEGPREAPEPVLRQLRPGDLGWVVYSQGAGYHEQFGWNEEYEALVARIAANFAAERDPERETGWIAELDGERVGSVFCVRANETTAKLRLLWVEPAARGRGIGSMLVRRCVDFARSVGYEAMTLWTVSMLHPARRLYQEVGFTLASEEPVKMFGQDDLVGQTWTLRLDERHQ